MWSNPRVPFKLANERPKPEPLNGNGPDQRVDNRSTKPLPTEVGRFIEGTT